MVAVGDGGVTAPGSVLVGVFGMLDARIGHTFVPMVTVFVMAMTVVHVVHVVAVADRNVTAVGPVDVRMLVLGRVILIGMPMRVGDGHAEVSHTHVPTRRNVRAYGPDEASTARWVWNGHMGFVDRVIDRTLDASVVGGYSRLGYAIRARSWDPLPSAALRGRTVVVTGPTSGLGFATARAMRSLGADLVLVGRDPGRLRKVETELSIDGGGSIGVAVADLGDLDAVRRAASEIRALGRLDVLVHNAGALTKERLESPQGFESTIATHVLGPHLLTSLLLDSLASGRVITVSSGGMYAAPLPKFSSGSSPELPSSRYDGTRQYAIAKRMQVTANEMWAERVRTIAFHSMHPGWADTPGVRHSLPGFARFTAPVLRTPDEGADTIVWLAAATDDDLGASGGFWCDRARRPIHRLPNTRRADTPSERVAMWDWIEKASGATAP